MPHVGHVEAVSQSARVKSVWRRERWADWRHAKVPIRSGFKEAREFTDGS